MMTFYSKALIIIVLTLFMIHTTEFNNSNAQELPSDYNTNNICWINQSGVLPLDSPSKDSEPRGTKTTLFQRVRYRYDQKKDGNFFEIGEIDETNPTKFKVNYGFIPIELALTNDVCLQVPETILDRKVMTVFRRPINPNGNMTEGVDPQLYEEVVLRESPTPDGPERERLKLFNILWVFAESNWTDPVTGFTKKYYLVGTNNSFAPERIDDDYPLDIKNVIKGWISADQCLHWSTRIAIQWENESTLPDANPRRINPARIYYSIADAYSDAYPVDYQKLSKKDPYKVVPFLTENFINDKLQGMVTRPWKSTDTRYPVVDSVIDYGSENTKFDNSEFSLQHPDGSNINSLLRIGAFGGAGDLDSQEIDDRRNTLEQLRSSLRQIEILFVIDNTASVEKVKSHIESAMNTVVEKSREVAGSSLKIAISFFNDDLDHGGNQIPVLTQSLLDQQEFQMALLDRLRNISAMNGGDAPELVFEGVRQSIANAGFSDLSQKLVVLIGDAGDRDSTENAIDQLLPYFDLGNACPIGFLAIRLPLDPMLDFVESRNAWTDFGKQMLNLSNKLKEGQKFRDSKRNLATMVEATDLSQIDEFVLAQYNSIKDDITRRDLELQNAAQGSSFATYGDDTKEILEAYGIKAETGVQPFQEAFVWKKDPEVSTIRRPATTYREMVLLNDNEITMIVKSLEELVAWREKGLNKQKSIKDVMQDVVKALVGEAEKRFELKDFKQQDFDNQSYGELIKKLMGIEVNTTLLKQKSEVNAAKYGSSNSIPFDDLAEIRLRYERLQDILDGKTAEYTAVEIKPEGGGKPYKVYKRGISKDVPDRRRYPISGSRAYWYWVDMKTEIP